MINLHDAVSAAKTYLADLETQDKLQDLRVEEVDTTQDGDWEITLGYYRKLDLNIVGGSTALAISPIVRENRVYKTVLVDRETGKGKRLKIREVTIR